jgi:hypothetical protein
MLATELAGLHTYISPTHLVTLFAMLRRNFGGGGFTRNLPCTRFMASNVCYDRGDQIGRLFAYWVTFYFVYVFFITEVGQIFVPLFFNANSDSF